jgi:hypothetical protein
VDSDHCERAEDAPAAPAPEPPGWAGFERAVRGWAHSVGELPGPSAEDPEANDRVDRLLAALRHPYQAMVDLATAQLAEARADLLLAEADAHRLRELLERGLVCPTCGPPPVHGLLPVQRSARPAALVEWLAEVEVELEEARRMNMEPLDRGETFHAKASVRFALLDEVARRLRALLEGRGDGR